MKKISKLIMVALLATISLSVSAQQVTTLYFLENAPMRHTINPAFQPVSNGYLNISPIGWSSMGFGNNTYTLSDFFLKDPTDPTKTITILHPNAGAQRTQFINSIPSMTLTSADAMLGIFNFGFRVKDNGYLTIGLNERLELGNTLPRTMLGLLMGGTLDLTDANVNLHGLGVAFQMYGEFGVGYSHRINEQWTVGGKAKLLLGQAYANARGNQFKIASSTDQWDITGNLDMDFAGPVNTNYLNSKIRGQSVQQIINEFEKGTFVMDSLVNTTDVGKLAVQLITPSGYGAAFDIGATYKPIEQLQISLAVTDLGFIYWTKANRYNADMNTTFNGLGVIDVNDPAYQDANGKFSIDKVTQAAVNKFQKMLNDIYVTSATSTSLCKMVSGRLNVGLDANFWDNRVGVGVVSSTRWYDARLYEEVTFGAAFRPVNWFNIAASYSLLNNGKYSNVGAALGFMPYDGINLTLAMDYIPTRYAGYQTKNSTVPWYIIPDQAKMINLALGLSICWGSNRTDKDHDGVWDKIDMCPNTPRGVQVDSVGCPLDEDHDGVPDYLDMCLGSPVEAAGHVDADGCPLDTDGDGVEDYRDKCPDTPEAAWGKVDSVGCPLDTDGDGVPDYLDLCPDTPEEGKNAVDATGCPIDSDNDGVPDYLDQCPNTPEAARATVDQRGCPIDSDGDGVADYMDECPDTPIEAAGKVDAKGCELDSDGDGVPDYLDECPYVIGVAANKGCPEVKREVRQLLNKAMQGIQFEAGKATIKASSHQILDLIADIFIENSNYIVEVQGHTDNTGKYEQNMKISQQRADAVMKYLIEKGVDAERLTAVGYGPDVPVADNKTKAGRAKNRRVEFKISFEEVSYESYNDRVEQAPAAETPAAEQTPAKEENKAE